MSIDLYDARYSHSIGCCQTAYPHIVILCGVRCYDSQKDLASSSDARYLPRIDCFQTSNLTAKSSPPTAFSYALPAFDPGRLDVLPTLDVSKRELLTKLLYLTVLHWYKAVLYHLLRAGTNGYCTVLLRRLRLTVIQKQKATVRGQAGRAETAIAGEAVEVSSPYAMSGTDLGPQYR
eukprot:1987580-Rhodomonas_salina.2